MTLSNTANTLKNSKRTILRLLLSLEMEPDDGVVHNPGEQEDLLDFFLLGSAA